MSRTLAALLTLALSTISHGQAAGEPAGISKAPTPPPAAAAAPSSTTPPAPTALAGAPDGQSLILKSIDATGGKTAFEGIRSVRLKVTIMTGRAPQDLVLLSSGKEKLLVTVPMPQIGGEIKMGRNGEHAWREIPNIGVQRATTQELDQIGQFALVPTIIWSLHQRYERFITVGEEKVGEEDAWRIHVSVPRDRSEPDQSVESHVLLRKSDLLPMVVERVISGQTARSVFSGWKKVDSIMIPARMEARAGTQAQSIEIVEASFNQVDESVFAVPDSIRNPQTVPSGK